jgi:hypothetical protein
VTTLIGVEVLPLRVRLANDLGLLEERFRVEFSCVPKSEIRGCITAAQAKVRTVPGEPKYIERVECHARPGIAALHSKKLSATRIHIGNGVQIAAQHRR